MTYEAQKNLAKWLTENTIFKTVYIDVQLKTVDKVTKPNYVNGLEYAYAGITDNQKAVCYIRPISDASVEKVSCNAMGLIEQTVLLVCYSNRSEFNYRYLVNQILSSPYGACIEKVITNREKLFSQEQKGCNPIPFRPNDVYFGMEILLQQQTQPCEDEICLIKDFVVCSE